MYLLISDMPLAHAMEREGDWIAISNGARIAIFEWDMSRLFDFIKIVRPTLFAAVPGA